MVRAFYPDHDRDAQLLAGGPGATVISVVHGIEGIDVWSGRIPIDGAKRSSSASSSTLNEKDPPHKWGVLPIAVRLEAR